MERLWVWLVMISMMFSNTDAKFDHMDPRWNIYCCNEDGSIEEEWAAIFRLEKYWQESRLPYLLQVKADEICTKDLKEHLERILDRKPDNALAWYYLLTRFAEPSAETINSAINYAIQKEDMVLYGGCCCYTSYLHAVRYEHLLLGREPDMAEREWWITTIFSSAESGCAYLSDEFAQWDNPYSSMDYLLQEIYDDYLRALRNCIHYSESDIRQREYVAMMEVAVELVDVPVYFKMLLCNEKLEIACRNQDADMVKCLYEEYSELKQYPLEKELEKYTAMDTLMDQMENTFKTLGLKEYSIAK